MSFTLHYKTSIKLLGKDKTTEHSKAFKTKDEANIAKWDLEQGDFGDINIFDIRIEPS